MEEISDKKPKKSSTYVLIGNRMLSKEQKEISRIFGEKTQYTERLSAFRQLKAKDQFNVYKALQFRMEGVEAKRKTENYTPTKDDLHALLILADFQKFGIENQSGGYLLKPVEKAKGYIYDDKEVGEYNKAVQEIFDVAHSNHELLKELSELTKMGRLNTDTISVPTEVRIKFSEYNDLLEFNKQEACTTLKGLSSGYAKKRDEADTMDFGEYNIINTSGYDEQNEESRKIFFKYLYAKKHDLTDLAVQKLEDNKSLPKKSNVFDNVLHNRTNLENCRELLSNEQNKKIITKQLDGVEQGTWNYVVKCFAAVAMIIFPPLAIAAAIASKDKKGTYDINAPEGIKAVNVAENIGKIFSKP